MDIETINYNDVEVYKNKLHECEAYYIESLNDKDDIYNTDVFNGLIDYIYLHCFRPDKRTKQYKQNAYYNHLQKSIIDYDDVETIFDLWCEYKLLCCKYKKTYTQQQFCSLIGISRDTFNGWKNGDTRNTSNIHSDIAKKISQDCEQAMLSQCVNNRNVMAAFVLKAGHGWREDQHVVIESNNGITHETAEQIAAKHAAAVLPEKPILD